MSATGYPESQPGTEKVEQVGYDSVERSTVRLSLEVSRDLDDLLNSLAKSIGATKSELLRKSIALMAVAVEAKENNEKLYVSKQAPEGTSREIVGI